MTRSFNKNYGLNRKLPLLLMVAWLILLFAAGGASRADVPGQFLVRIGAWAIIFCIILMRIPLREKKIGWTGGLLIAAAFVPALQLVPLPPEIWMNLPGRGLFAEAAKASGQAQPWRPISIAPWATVNALASLIVPAATFLLVLALDRADRDRLVTCFLIFVLLCAIFALFQAGGMSIQSPFVNYRVGAVSGPFANRNHMATLCAIGCVIMPLRSSRSAQFTLLTALGVLFGLLFLVFVGLATGSRAAIPLMATGCAIGLWLSRARFLSLLADFTRPKAVWAIGAAVMVFAATLGAFVFSGRALSIDRAMNWHLTDVRAELIPVTFDLARKYFPIGTGFGTFDHAFRIDEPTEMLMIQHYNLAHNDLLQIVMDGGLLGAVVLIAGLAAWALKTFAALRSEPSERMLLGLAASAALGLIIFASLVDYPGRTPIFMAWIVVLFVWLETASDPLPDRSAGNRAA